MSDTSPTDKNSEAFVLREIAECKALAEGQKEFLRRLAARISEPARLRLDGIDGVWQTSLSAPSADQASNSVVQRLALLRDAVQRCCPTCGGDGKLTDQPGTFKACHTCDGTGAVAPASSVRDPNWADRLRAKLKEASRGEVNTWGFVAMFMEMIDEVEKESPASASREHCPHCGVGYDRGAAHQCYALPKAMEADAARYRWLRKNALWRTGYREQSVTWDVYMPEPDIREGKMTDDSVHLELDAAIDRAMQSRSEGRAD